MTLEAQTRRLRLCCCVCYEIVPRFAAARRVSKGPVFTQKAAMI